MGTFLQCFLTLPSGPIQTVERMTPVVFLPYIIFSPKASYLLITFLSGSQSRVNGSLYLDANFLCDASSSGETPSTTAPRFLMAVCKSRKPHACLVQPGVSSFG